MGTSSGGPLNDRPTFTPRSLGDYIREQEATEVRLLPPDPPKAPEPAETRSPVGSSTADLAAVAVGGSPSATQAGEGGASGKLFEAEKTPLQTHLFRLFGVVVLGVAVGGIVWGLYRVGEAVSEPGEKLAASIGQTLRITPEKIRAEVTLVNECPYGEEAFMVKVVPDGPTALFRQGKASIEALDNQRLQIVANSNYPDFHYETNHVRVAPQMRMVANCDSAKEHLKATAESLRKSFNK